MNKLFSDGVGLDWYATPFRGYDPQVGRFWQIDELSEMYESFSVYNFAFNNPIYFNDPTGLDPATQVTPNNNDPKVEVLPEVVVLGSRRNSWNYDHWALFADANKHHDPTDLHKYLSESGVDERGLRLFNTAWKNIGYRERRYEIEVRYRERVELILKTALDYTPPGRGATILKVTYKVVKNAGREAAKGVGKGTQVNSKTLWKGKGKERIDVENPNPSQRPGQVHYQDNKGGKYIYDPATGQFKNAPNSVNDLLKNTEFKRGIEKGLKYLGY